MAMAITQKLVHLLSVIVNEGYENRVKSTDETRGHRSGAGRKRRRLALS
jgi:hypothetical protein